MATQPGTSRDWAEVWAEVDEQLEAVGQDFTDPKFYALKHVVEILSSNQPQAMVEELREQEARLMTLVDALATGYHSGFARSIQNYSQILQLFGDATQQVDGLKKSLADAHRQLAVQSRHLHQQWRKSMMLEAQTKLLADVQLVVDAPGRIQAALDAQDWPAAVSVLQEAAARLARDSLVRIMALRKLRADVAGACSAIQAQLLQELHARIYGHTAGGVGPLGSGGSGSRPGSPRRIAPPGGGGGGGGGGGALERSGSGKFTGVARRSRLGQERSPALSRQSSATPGASGSSMPQFVLEALADRGDGGHAARLASLRELVGCLVQIDGLEEAKAYLTLHARGEVRRMVRRAIEGWAFSAEERAGGAAALAAALGAAPAAAGTGGPGGGAGAAGGTGGRGAAGGGAGTAGSGGWEVSPALHAAVGRLAKAVFDECLRALANLGRLLQEISEAPADAATPAIALLKQQGQQAAPGGEAEAGAGAAGGAGAVGGGAAGPGGAGDGGPLAKVSSSAGSFTGGGGRVASSAALERLRALGGVSYVRAEYEHVWEQMQEEVQQLLSELLHAQLRGPQATLGVASKPGGWLAELAELASSAAGFGVGGSGSGLGALGVSGGAPSGSGNAGSAGGGGAAGVLSSGASPGGMLPMGPGGGGDGGGGASRLVFSLEVGGAWLDAPQLQRAAAVAGGAAAVGSAAAVAAAAEVGAAAKEAHSYGPLVGRALAGHRGGPYLTPAVYGPVRRFCEDALVVMRSSGPSSGRGAAGPSTTAAAVAAAAAAAATAAAATGGGPASTASGADSPPSPASPRRGEPPAIDDGADASAAGPAAAGAGTGAAGAWLLASLESYVADTFLPQVWVDLRGRCTAMLEDADAFRPATEFQAAQAAAALQQAGAGPSGGPPPAGLAPPVRPPRGVVPAALFAAQVVGEVMGWVRDIPVTASSTLTGVVDAILGRILEAFAAAAMRALGDCRARRLALRPDVGLVMSGEPDAPLLGDAIAYYVPRSQDTFDGAAFLAAVKSPDKPVIVPGIYRPPLKAHGFGLEGDAAAEEVLLLVNRDRPASAEQIMAGQRTQALVTLAALSESLDFVADRIQQFAAASGFAGARRGALARAGSGASAVGGAVGGSPSGPSQPPRAGGAAAQGAIRSARAALSRVSGGGVGGAAGGSASSPSSLMETLAVTADRYRSLAGACVRAIRLDLLLLAAHHIGAVAASGHLCEPDDARQAHPAVGALTRAAGRAAEELAPYLSPRKAAYTLGCVAPAAARYLVWAAQEIPSMNALGAERLIRTLAVMQGPLTALALPGGPISAASGPDAAAAAAAAAGVAPASAEAARAYERAKSYYTLITLPASEVVRLAGDRPLRYSAAEWGALLSVRVPGRPVGDAHVAALQKTLDRTFNLSAGKKVAAALEEFGSRVQAPVVSIADSISAGIKGGVLQARALLKQAAEATTAAVQQAQAGAAQAAAQAAARLPTSAASGGGDAQEARSDKDRTNPSKQ